LVVLVGRQGRNPTVDVPEQEDRIRRFARGCPGFHVDAGSAEFHDTAFAA
jgi:hypothetical protein